MNRKYILLLLVIPTLLATSCEFFIEETASTPEARMEAFVADVNAERWDSMRRHFHPDSDNYDSGDFPRTITRYGTFSKRMYHSPVSMFPPRPPPAGAATTVPSSSSPWWNTKPIISRSGTSTSRNRCSGTSTEQIARISVPARPARKIQPVYEGESHENTDTRSCRTRGTDVIRRL